VEADRLARVAIAGVALHELAHCCRSGYFGAEATIDPDVGVSREGFFRFVGTPPDKQRNPAPDSVCPYTHHDGQFIRAALHLGHRAKAKIPGLTFGHVIDGPTYSISSPEAYAIMLSDELQSERHNAITNIVRDVAAPREFRELYRSDVFKWFSGLPDPTPEQEEAALKALAALP
jgi:hypothetical protein